MKGQVIIIKDIDLNQNIINIDENLSGVYIIELINVTNNFRFYREIIII